MEQDNKYIVCEFDFCIYNKDCTCILDRISISPTGACSECILPHINEHLLQKFKNETLSRIILTSRNRKL